MSPHSEEGRDHRRPPWRHPWRGFPSLQWQPHRVWSSGLATQPNRVHSHPQTSRMLRTCPPFTLDYGAAVTTVLCAFALRLAVHVCRFVFKLCFAPLLAPKRRPTVVNATTSCCCCPFSSMFRTKRSCLIKRLAKLSTHEAKREVEAVLKRLETRHLEALALSVESAGAEVAPCVVLPMGEMLPLPTLPHVFFCQLWRWADLRLAHELRQLPACQTPHDALCVCANPFHWSRLYKPDSPPPPYSRHPQELSKNSYEDSVPSEPVSPDSRFSSYLSGCTESPHTWCKVAYWELSDRVGRLLPVNQPAINVFFDLPHGDGLCLQTLANSHSTDNSSVLQTRTKIGHGVTVFKEDQEVWVYNRSEYPVFVNSPTLDPPNTEKLTVHKLPPGFSIKIFDYERARYNQRVRDSSLMKNGPFDPHAVRISFAKGFGSSKYSRRFITSCPCWLEVMFLVNR